MTLYEENLIEIAWVDEYLSLNNKYEENTDSMDEKMAIIELAKKFEEENKEKDWELKGDYYEEIFKYAEKELLKQFGKEN